jgi:hypothetical protein
MEAFQQDWRSVSVPGSYQQAADGSYGFADVARAQAGFGSALAGSAQGSSPPSGWAVPNLVSYKNLGSALVGQPPDMSNRVPIEPLDELVDNLAFYLFEKFITNYKLSIKQLSQVSESWLRFIADEMEKLDVGE